jgi:hypothetical protein
MHQIRERTPLLIGVREEGGRHASAEWPLRECELAGTSFAAGVAR